MILWMMVFKVVMKRITIMKYFSRTGFKQIWRSKIFSMQPTPQRIRFNFAFCITLFVFDLLSGNKFTFSCCPSSKSFQENCPNLTVHYSLCIVKVQVVMQARVSDSEGSLYVFTSRWAEWSVGNQQSEKYGAGGKVTFLSLGLWT